MSYVPHMQFSHLGLYVSDLDKMVDFYTRVLGFMITDRGMSSIGVEMVFMSRDPSEHHQIVFAPGKPPDAPSQINQISFRLGSLSELRRMHDIVRRENEVSDLTPMSHGNSWSVYFKDPEGNRLEMFVQTPWYVPAPRGMKLDLSQSDEEIFEQTAETVKTIEGFKTRTQWHKDAADEMMATGAWPGDWKR